MAQARLLILDGDVPQEAITTEARNVMGASASASLPPAHHRLDELDPVYGAYWPT